MRIIWRKNESPLFDFIIIGIVCFIMVSISSIFLLRKHDVWQNQLRVAGNIRHETYLLADQLRQSSDDLTRMVRTYAATGESKFEEMFWDVLAIRDGTKARPLHYERVYWDFMSTEEPIEPFQKGEAISLEGLMRRDGFTEKEFEMLDVARQRSDKLVHFEQIAMDAMKGIPTSEPDPGLALDILFGEEYHQAKKSIMEPINEFLESIDNRTMNDVVLAETKASFYKSILTVSFYALVLTSIFLLIMTFLYHKLMVGKLNVSIDKKTVKLSAVNKELKREKEKAEAANHAKSEFLANMNHDLRTPLNVILGFNRLMMRDSEMYEKYAEELKLIGHNGKHLLQLINSVLDIAKIESGHIDLLDNDFDFLFFLRDISEISHWQAQGKGLLFSCELGENLPHYIKADESKLRQVLNNLIGNAFKFTETGKIILRVNRNLPVPGAVKLNFEIEDTGVGFSKDKSETIFEPFVQNRQNGQLQSGTGLGLAINRQIVSAMDGILSVESVGGKGSIFRFSVVIKEISAVKVNREQLVPRVISLAPGQRIMRILVVEDMDESRKLLVTLLKTVGFDVQEASDGKQGVEVFTSWHPDLIWMDLRMPVMDGYEATKEIKKTEAGRKTTVIALTAHAFEEKRQEILNAGCDDFIRKPFIEEELFALMEKYLGIEFIYEDQNAALPDLFINPVDFLTVEILAELPKEIKNDLLKFTSLLDQKACLTILEKLSVTNKEVAAALHMLVENYQFEELENILNRNGGKK